MKKKKAKQKKPEPQKADLLALHPEAVAGVLRMTATHAERIPILFQCGKCFQSSVGLMEHRDRIPTRCSTCEPRSGEMTWKSEWLVVPEQDMKTNKVAGYSGPPLKAI